jgi:protein-tyrosine phosphatase
LPDLDDGPTTMAEAVALCAALAGDHIGTVVATPHQLGRFGSATSADVVRGAVAVLRQQLRNKGVDLEVLVGGEVRLDERIPDLIQQGDILTLGELGRHLLLELPDDVFIDIGPLCAELRAMGIEAVIAHPERNGALLGQRLLLQRWVQEGMSLQVTAGSLFGDFGPRVRQRAWDLLIEGAVATVATDAHDAGRNRPRMTEAFEAIREYIGGDLAHLVCVENPSRVVRGKALLSRAGWVRQGVG